MEYHSPEPERVIGSVGEAYLEALNVKNLKLLKEMLRQLRDLQARGGLSLVLNKIVSIRASQTMSAGDGPEPSRGDKDLIKKLPQQTRFSN